MNNLIAITQQGDALVVDSRLIAERLGVNHSDWYRNIILKYQTDTEQAFGKLRFENGEIKGRGQPEKCCLLTEDQATFLMTLSRNTPEVVACKATLVKSFSEAKRIIQAKGYAPYWYQRLTLFLAQNKVPAGYFSIFQETIILVSELETAGYVLSDSAIPDISIGKCWANYLRTERINPNDVAISYSHQYPGWTHPVDANAYPEELLPKFRKWFREVYKPIKLPSYLAGKGVDALPALSKMLGVPIAALK